MAVGVDGGNNLGVVGHFDGQRGAAVESLLGTEHTGAAVGERRQFQRVLVGLGSAVDEEQLVVVIAADLAQSLGQLLLQLVNHRVRVEPNLIELLRHLLYVVRMRMSDGDDGMTAVEVQIFLPLVVPYVATLSFHNVYVEQGINIE